MLEEKPSRASTPARDTHTAPKEPSGPFVQVSGWTPCNGAEYLRAKKIEQVQEEQEERQDQQDSPTREFITPADQDATPTRKDTAPTRIRYTPNNVPRDHQALFSGDIKYLHHDALFRLAKHWTMTQVAEHVNAAHGAEVVNQKKLSNRLSKDIGIMAERDGKPRDALLQELRTAQRANGVPINGRWSTSSSTSSKKRSGSPKRKQRTNPDFIPGLADRDGDIDMAQEDRSSSPTRASEFGEEHTEEQEVEDADDEGASEDDENDESDNEATTKPKATVLGKRRR